MDSRSENDRNPILMIRTGVVFVQMDPDHVISGPAGHVRISTVGDVHVRPDWTWYSGVTGQARFRVRREFLGHLLLNTPVLILSSCFNVSKNTNLKTLTSDILHTIILRNVH